MADSAGRLTVTSGVITTTAGTRTQSLWSSDVPPSETDPSLIRAGDAMRWPAGAGNYMNRGHGIDGADTQSVVFREDSDRGDSWSVRVAIRELGGEWQDPAQLSTELGYLYDVQLAVNAAGAAIATWNPTPHELFAAYRPSAGAPWTPQQRLTRRGYHHQAGIDDAGNVIVIHRGIDGGHIRARRFDPASGWGAARRVTRTPDSYNSNLAVSPNGAAVITWDEASPGPADRHYTKRMTAAGSWLATVRRRGGVIHEEGLAIDGRGVATATWWSKRKEVMTQVGRRDGTWGRGRAVAGPQRNPDPFGLKIALNPGGDAFVVWKAAPKGEPRLRGRYRPHRGPWVPLPRLTPAGTNPNMYAATVAANGDAGVAWDGGRAVRARRLVACPV